MPGHATPAQAAASPHLYIFIVLEKPTRPEPPRGRPDGGFGWQPTSAGISGPIRELCGQNCAGFPVVFCNSDAAENPRKSRVTQARR
jgi:hypothetical protein